VVGLTRNTAYTYGKLGVRCNAVCPGGVNTNIGQSMPQEKQTWRASAPSRRSTSPRSGWPSRSNSPSLVTYLMTDEAANVSGGDHPERRRLVGRLTDLTRRPGRREISRTAPVLRSLSLASSPTSLSPPARRSPRAC
jgi:NAD(P)-dependent dehydrogenase (short-subunit alcohol dehydrogenase family)